MRLHASLQLRREGPRRGCGWCGSLQPAHAVACKREDDLTAGMATGTGRRERGRNATCETGGMPNRLAAETSPYLLQHAHNPVDWYPWGSEALQRARGEDRPIFLSIG